MSDERFRDGQFTRPRSVPMPPQAAQAQKPEGQPEPDFLAYAADQLRRAHLGVTRMAENLKEEGGEASEKVIALRLQLAQGYTALADIQYSLPDDEGDEDEDYEDDEADARRR